MNLVCLEVDQYYYTKKPLRFVDRYVCETVYYAISSYK